MAISNTPDSFVVTANSNTWREFLIALEDHVVNNTNSTKWDLQNRDDDGTNYGITLKPVDADENFYVNYRYDDSSGELLMTVDPEENISNPLSPNLSGAAAPESPRAGRPGAPSGYSSEILVMEWTDTIGFLTKDSTKKYLPSWHIGGRVYEPIFSNDPPRGLDGLGWYGGRPEDLQYRWGSDGNSNSASQFRVPGGWAQVQSREMDQDGGHTLSWSSFIPSSYMITDVNDVNRSIGIAKYAFNSPNEHGREGIRRLGGGANDGWISMSYDGDGHNLLIPWDHSVSPS